MFYTICSAREYLALDRYMYLIQWVYWDSAISAVILQSTCFITKRTTYLANTQILICKSWQGPRLVFKLPTKTHQWENLVGQTLHPLSAQSRSHLSPSGYSRGRLQQIVNGSVSITKMNSSAIGGPSSPISCCLISRHWMRVMRNMSEGCHTQYMKMRVIRAGSQSNWLQNPFAQRVLISMRNLDAS